MQAFPRFSRLTALVMTLGLALASASAAHADLCTPGKRIHVVNEDARLTNGPVIPGVGRVRIELCTQQPNKSWACSLSKTVDRWVLEDTVERYRGSRSDATFGYGLISALVSTGVGAIFISEKPRLVALAAAIGALGGGAAALATTPGHNIGKAAQSLLDTTPNVCSNVSERDWRRIASSTSQGLAEMNGNVLVDNLQAKHVTQAPPTDGIDGSTPRAVAQTSAH